MMLNLLDQIGDWNPQLLREIKGRLKTRNVLTTAAASLVGQLLILLYFYTQLPFEDTYSKHYDQIYNRYCTGPHNYSQPSCLKDALGDFIINWQLWWQDLFMALCWISIFYLLILGTFLLMSDLSTEERRGTLNFIRLSPQSEVNILSGKLLGVPILLYFVVILAVPLHLWAGFSAEIPLLGILLFYLVIAASCIFFYSGALLCGAITSRYSGFLPWLGGGVVFAFLMLTTGMTHGYQSLDNPLAWLRLLSPIDSMLYLFSSSYGSIEDWFDWQWYYLPVGASTLGFVGFVILNYALWTYWIWQGLQRCFRNPNTTILSKRQSYLLIACFEGVILGCALQEEISYSSHWAFEHLFYLTAFSTILIFGLIATLSPSRQTLLDWARFRRERVSNPQGFRKSTMVPDLIWGEKSPAVVAMAINIVIVAIPLVTWSLFGPFDSDEKTQMLFCVAFFVSLMMIYATITQIMLMMRTSKRSVWATGTIVAAVLLPPTILGVLGIDPYHNTIPWLFSTFPWAAIESAAINTMFMALLAQLSVLTLLNLQLRRQLRIAGESASKALLEGRRSLPTG
ncbi:MAG: ABC transporter permease [Symploca sp. SIO2B6]|nr:ABC transporter permease [Symploca sp. SIO2B6]